MSVKVFAAQSHLIRLGFRSGGPAGFGLRRLVIDSDGKPRFLLAAKQGKALSTDRVILVPGPDEEIAIVAEIYRLFVVERTDETAIARILNGRGILGEDGRRWSQRTVREVLTNEKYVGDNVWGRYSFKLKVQKVANPRHQWIRRDRAFQPIVDRELFERAQAIVALRCDLGTDEELLAMLRPLLERNGRLTEAMIDATPDVPSTHTYRKRFGTLIRAYALIGFSNHRDSDYIEVNRRLRLLRSSWVLEIMARVERAGASVALDDETGLLAINDEFSASIVVLRCVKNPCGSPRWDFRPDASTKPDLVIAIRMAEDNETTKDFHLLPPSVAVRTAYRLKERNGLPLDAYRFDSLDCLYQMAARRPLRRKAFAAAAPR